MASFEWDAISGQLCWTRQHQHKCVELNQSKCRTLKQVMRQRSMLRLNGCTHHNKSIKGQTTNHHFSQQIRLSVDQMPKICSLNFHFLFSNSINESAIVFFCGFEYRPSTLEINIMFGTLNYNSIQEWKNRKQLTLFCMKRNGLPCNTFRKTCHKY